ncbi:hypothetical protein [Micromonospora sp. DT227]|uniref:hypothetical protein n=1 Tax=Micromonospora sp. DT227 TaxID=3393433 RepID=UPI003CF60A0A
MVIVLDNARTADQVRPLLPAASRSVVLVTSRDCRTGLVAAAAAQPLALGPLPPPAARALLRSRLGSGRGTTTDALGDIVAACGGLPLALTIAGARLAGDHGAGRRQRRRDVPGAGGAALTTLARLHLIDESAPGRFRQHDVLHRYATELLHASETAAERSAARDRLLATTGVNRFPQSAQMPGSPALAAVPSHLRAGWAGKRSTFV